MIVIVQSLVIISGMSFSKLERGVHCTVNDVIIHIPSPKWERFSIFSMPLHLNSVIGGVEFTRIRNMVRTKVIT